MTTEMHATIGLAVLVVNLLVGIWALLRARSGAAGDRGLTIATMVAFGLLVVQVLIGADFWFRGARPAASPLAEIHALGPVVALVIALYLLFVRKTPAAGRYAASTLATAFIALLAYGIGEMGG